jgi:hypothetical protein
MARYDYEMYKMVVSNDPSFESLIMAAYRKADTANAAALRALWPGIVDELQARYNAPGGILEGDPS